MGGLSFLSPWLLLALAALPALWWLLKITPPAARRIPFPALRILRELESEEETPARTPLWLAILRLVLASLVVVALAHPLLGAGARFQGSGPVLLVIDDGWASAPDWPKRQAVMRDLLAAAVRERRSVAVLTTAPPESGDAIPQPQVERASDAQKLVQALSPKPWPTDRAAALKALQAALAESANETLHKPAAIIWIGDGLGGKNGAGTALATALAKLGKVRLLSGDPDLPHLVLPPTTEGGHYLVKALRPSRLAAPPERVTLRALDETGHVMAAQPLVFAKGAAEAETELNLPPEVANGIARLDVAEESGAGAVFLVDERWRRRLVGLATTTPQESDRPLLGDLYYLKRALSPYSEVRIGKLDDLLKAGTSVIALPDSVALSPQDRKNLEAWIAKGGVLVRFAGPHMAEAADLAAGTPRDALIPVSLRRGGRALGGVMSWTAPMALAPFDASSPFAGLKVPKDVQVQRQVLAEPSLGLGSKTWAQLADGTPLVTGERRGSGWLVLFHITANADWSNLPLSGLFVDMLHRLVEMARGAVAKAGGAPLPPYRSLDGFGRLEAPPIAAIAYDPAAPPALGPQHPPGYYGNESARLAFNLGGAVPAPVAMRNLPPNVVEQNLQPAAAFDLKPWLWLGAFFLALVDLVVSLGLRGLLPTGFWRRAPRAAAGAALVLGLSLAPAHAQDMPAAGDDYIVRATATTHLAYVITGDAATDAESEAGLKGLSRIVNRRTAAELDTPMGLDIEHDQLLFFPLIYWPVWTPQPPLSAEAVARIDKYLATGGIILFDTGDAKLGLGTSRRGISWDAPGAANLRKIVENLRIPPLVPIPADHVLTKSYYLMQEFPGRFAGGTLWVAAAEGQANDGVSPVLVGANDFAGAWALDQDGRTVYPVVPGGNRQREQAFRFGINLVMYALTGNYKSDQVHVPAILERLGQ